MALPAWLLERGVTHVGMEATGVHWRPVHAALEGAFILIVGNASPMRNVPGRKTDVTDAAWIADPVWHGRVRASFVPPPEVRVLRALVRHRKALVGTLAAERNRTLKLLKSAGVKLAGVMSSVFGVSGMLMLRALAAGTGRPCRDGQPRQTAAVQARPAHPRARRAAGRAPAPAARHAHSRSGGDRS